MPLFVPLLFLVSQVSVAEEQVLIGRVHELHLYSKEHGQCSDGCVPGVENQNGSVAVCISNACGCGVAVLTVDKQLKGNSVGPLVSIKFTVGEWCEAEFSADGRPVLVQLEDGSVNTGKLVSYPSPAAQFEGKQFHVLGGVDVSDIKTKDGMVSLKDWLHRADF